MPALQLFLPLFLIVRLALGAGLLPELGNHLGLCPNQLNPSLWVDAQSTCERECTRDQVSMGTPRSLGCLAPSQPFPWGWGAAPGTHFLLGLSTLFCQGFGHAHTRGLGDTPSLPSPENAAPFPHNTCLFPAWAAVIL